VFNPLSYFNFQHDQDLAGWIVKDVVVNKHIRLIGQETSSQGVFIGPLFYYAQIPFYVLGQMDPAGSLVLVTLLGMFAIFSFYFVFSKVFNQRTGLVASLIHALSYLIIFVDREVAPTMPVMLWSVWFFYCLWLILKGKSKTYLLIGFLVGLIWNLNLALLLLTPLIPLAQFLSRKKVVIKHIFLGAVIFFVTLSPFIVFEVRHGFSQTRAISSSLISNKDYEGGSTPGLAKLDRVMQLVHMNSTRLFWGPHYPQGLVKFTFFGLLAVFGFLSYKKILSKAMSVIMLVWFSLYVIFFTLNSINVSEYYLNGANVILIGIASLGIDYLFGKKDKIKYLSFLLLIVFVALNLYSFSQHYTNGNGYVEKKKLTAFIKNDAKSHDYPCVAISYITSPGYQFGYRYFLWLEGLKVKRPLSGSPVYSIVFPLSNVNRFDQRFGNLGLVLPDYQGYTKESVEKACQGQDENLTEPMFSYTQ
jgi:hypothetical protein